jgi:hypothetical protein
MCMHYIIIIIVLYCVLLLLLLFYYWALEALFNFLTLYTVGRTPWKRDQPKARPLPTHMTIQTRNKHVQAFMARAAFESTTPVSEQPNTVHASVRTDTVFGIRNVYQ